MRIQLYIQPNKKLMCEKVSRIAIPSLPKEHAELAAPGHIAGCVRWLWNKHITVL